MKRVGIRELQQNASAVVRRVQAGERVEVAHRGRAVALLVPLPRSNLRALLAEAGKLALAQGDLLELGAPLRKPAGATTASRELSRMRAHER